jgi:hypothetical protein
MFKSGIGNIMQKAQKMQEGIKRVKAELKDIIVTGQAGNGKVKITINGEHIATNIDIDKDILNEKEQLQDLILIAINDANQKIKTQSKDKIKSVTGDIDLPLPF